MKSRVLALFVSFALMVILGVGVWSWQQRRPKENPGPPAYLEAMRNLKEGRVNAAEAAFKESLVAQPSFAAARAELGNLYLLKRALPRAISSLEAASFLDPNQPHVFARLAQAYLDARRQDEAREAVQEALRREPGSAYALTIQGELQLRDDNMTEALASFRSAIQNDPAFSLPYGKAGFVLVKLQRLEEAEALMMEGLKHDPNNPALHFHLAETYWLRPQLPNSASLAKKHYQLALPNNPSAANVHSRLGELARRQDDAVTARRHFERALRQDPRQAAALYGMAQLESQAGNKAVSAVWTRRLQAIRNEDDALANLRNQAQAYPQDAARACKVGRYALEHGLLSEAERQIERAVRWHPEHREARLLRASLYESQGRTEEAANERKVAARLRN
jgi:tetratricopeptide (TPR) repeat protein